MKILNLDPYMYSEAAQNVLKSCGELESLSFDREALSEKILDVDVLVLRFAHRLDKSLLKNAKNLKVIATNATGTNHIDTDYAESIGVKILSLKGEYEFLRSIHATAELTWGLLLALTRNICEASDSVGFGLWDRNSFIGRELFGKTIGIVGLGRIGEKIARYAEAFGMVVEAWDTDDQVFDRNPKVKALGSLEECLGRADVVSIHVPYTNETHDLIGAAEFECMKNSALFLNTSRGEIVVEQALRRCLQQNEIAGAALDVLEGEHGDDFPEGNQLVTYSKSNSNLVITPHIGGVTQESWEKTELFIANKVKEFLFPKGALNNGSH